MCNKCTLDRDFEEKGKKNSGGRKCSKYARDLIELVIPSKCNKSYHPLYFCASVVRIKGVFDTQAKLKLGKRFSKITRYFIKRQHVNIFPLSKYVPLIHGVGQSILDKKSVL